MEIAERAKRGSLAPWRKMFPSNHFPPHTHTKRLESTGVGFSVTSGDRYSLSRGTFLRH